MNDAVLQVVPRLFADKAGANVAPERTMPASCTARFHGMSEAVPAGMPAVQPEAVAEVVSPPPEASLPGPPEPEPDMSPAAVAGRMFPNMGVDTRGPVVWSEPSALAGQFDLSRPEMLPAMTQEDRAAEGRLRAALSEAGVGRAMAVEVWKDALSAQLRGVPRVDAATAEADLRSVWGSNYEANMAAANGVVQAMAATSPELLPFLRRTGLGNDPGFIRKVAAWAAVRKSTAAQADLLKRRG